MEDFLKNFALKDGLYNLKHFIQFDEKVFKRKYVKGKI